MSAEGAMARPGRSPMAPGAGGRGAARRRGERGTTLIELMIAGVILLVALLGFAGMAGTSATATGVAHRRGTAAYMESGLVDRYLVRPRTAYAGMPGSTWVIDTCYDVSGQPTGTSNTAYSSSFTCPADAYYRTWVRISGSGPWGLQVYAERIDPGCSADTRYASLACVAADITLTD